MSLSNQYKRVPCKSIIIEREARQRRKIETGNLKESIEARGVINPIIITRDFKLVAGERRLTSSLELGLVDIPCRFVDDLSEDEQQLIELEENTRRSDLCWQDMIRALGRLHGFYSAADPTHTITKTCKLTGYSLPNMSKFLRVFEDIEDPKINTLPNFATAYNFLLRKDSRGIDNAMSLILEIGSELAQGPAPTAQAEPPAAGGELSLADLDGIMGPAVVLPPAPPPVAKPKPLLLPAEDSILHASFLDWAPAYAGPTFNFVHCDFPYGVGVFDGKQSGREAHGVYDDQEDIFWTLLRSFLSHRDRLCQTSCHLMFWYSMDFHTEVLRTFAELAPEFVPNPFPLVWHKSDNSGIIPDTKRGPRRAYETALFFSRGDRFVVRPVANLYPAPTNKLLHPHTKPEPMLRHFFGLFVDEHTRVLDPTCGSGSSLRAAESLGAQHVLGLEQNAQWREAACGALKNFRVLAAASKP